MKKIMMLFLMISSMSLIFSNDETLKQAVKEVVCEGPYQTFEGFPSFDKKPFVLDPQFLHFDPNIFHTPPILSANYDISKLLPWQWYNIHKIAYITQIGRRQERLEDINIDTTNTKKLTDYCPVIQGNLVHIEAELDLKKKKPQEVTKIFDPHIIHRIFELLKFQKLNINPSKRIVGRFAQPELIGFGLKLFSIEFFKNFTITAQTISTIMNLEPNTVIRLIRYIQSAYYYHVMINDDESLYKWLKDKKILDDVLRRQFTNTYDLIQQKKIAITPADVASINKLNAYYEAGAIWKAIGIISEVASECASSRK